MNKGSIVERLCSDLIAKNSDINGLLYFYFTWKDHVTNVEVLSRTGQRRLQDIVAERRLRMAGHIIRMPPG